MTPRGAALPLPFQSTPSGRKATSWPEHVPVVIIVSIHAFREEGDPRGRSCSPLPTPRFNPRLPGGRRPPAAPTRPARLCVSIHAFREEGDLRGAKTKDSLRVSIHAFREEGDVEDGSEATIRLGFNPRLPGGRRPRSTRPKCWRRRFNPRLPGGRRPIRL